MPLICVYCGKETSDAEAEEHILPELLGCKDVLYRGAVCGDCNHTLGHNVDQHFFDEPLIAAGQVASSVAGKAGSREQVGKHVRKEGNTTIIGGRSGRDHEHPVGRAIAKCEVNIFTHYFGSKIVREELHDLVTYVQQPKSRKDVWPFAAIYMPMTTITISYVTGVFRSRDGPYPIFRFTCSSGLFASPAQRHMPSGAEKMLGLLKRDLGDAEKRKGTDIGKTGMKVEYRTGSNLTMVTIR